MDFSGLTTSDDLIVSQANTRCPFDNSADVMDCVRHEPGYTDALLIPVSKLVSFARTFSPAAVTSPFDTDYDSSSGREPCLPVDDDCEMFSGESDGSYDILNTRTSTTRSSIAHRDDVKTTPTPQKPSKRITTTAASIATTSTSGVSSSTPAKKRRTTTTITTTTAPSAATTSQSTLSSSPTTTTTTTTVTTTPIVVTVPKGFPDQPPYYGASGPYPVDGQGGQINPDGNPHYGVGGAVESRRNDLEQLKLNVGLIIGVAIGLSILLLIVAFVLYRYRGRPGELTSVHQALMKSDAQGGGLDAKKPYVYDTCNTMPPTPEMSVAPSRPLVAGTNTCSRSINVASATLPTQNHHQRNYQQQQSQQQQPNGAKTEVKEWYV